MPRAVSAWTWRRALRDHGPKSPSVLLTLYTIAVSMNRDGYAFPSQDNIAKGARTSTRTVQRHIAEAKRAGWIAAELAGRGGKGWRFTCYRACVPDDLNLDDLDENISTAIEAQEGGVRDDTIASSPRANGHDTNMSARSEHNQGRDDNGRGVVTTNGAGGDDKSSSSWRHNSVVLTPALRTPAYRTHAVEAQRFAPSTRDVSSKREGKEPEVEQGKPSITDQQLWQVLNDIGPEHEYKVKALTTILSHRYLDVTEDRLWRVIRTEQAKRDQRKVVA